MTKKSDLQDREDLARTLRLALHTREWNQSDLARAATLPRELISSYINGRAAQNISARAGHAQTVPTTTKYPACTVQCSPSTWSASATTTPT